MHRRGRHLPEASEEGFLQVTSEISLVQLIKIHQEKEEEESQDNRKDEQRPEAAKKSPGHGK